ncbi:MAG TPA: DUF2125 domain-containing protein [Rhizomicrobium sp.]|jgi:hypothetical protein|nr:DUF2125 domain-containing protein [Rhizomicrobium sp.]
MKYSSRLFLWAPFVLLLALAVGVSARWYQVANALSAKLDTMNGREVIPGVSLHFASKTVGGFPFRVDAVFKNLELGMIGPHGLITWRAEDFAAHALTYGREKWIFEAAGKQRLSWTTRNGEPKGLPFESGSLHASAVFREAKLDRFDLDLVGFDSAALNAARIQFHARHNPKADRIDVVADVEEIHLSPPLRGLCGEVVDHVKLDGDFSNAAAFAKAITGDAKWQSGFDAWRSQGGRFFLGQSEIACGRSSAFVQGQLGLDAQKRPRGLLTAQLVGLGALGESAEHGPPLGTFAKALLDQPRDPNPAQEGRVTVRAAFRDGISYLGNTPAGTNDPQY